MEGVNPASEPLVHTSAGKIPISHFGRVTLDGDDDVIRTSVTAKGTSIKYKWVLTLNMRKHGYWVPEYGPVPPRIRYYFETYEEGQQLFYKFVDTLIKYYKKYQNHPTIDRSWIRRH